MRASRHAILDARGAGRDSRAYQPCPLFSPGQNRSGESTGDREARATPGALGGAGRWALILPWDAGCGALVSAPQRPCQPCGSPGDADSWAEARHDTAEPRQRTIGACSAGSLVHFCKNLQALEKLEPFYKTLLFSAESMKCAVNDQALRGACQGHFVRTVQWLFPS